MGILHSQTKFHINQSFGKGSKSLKGDDSTDKSDVEISHDHNTFSYLYKNVMTERGSVFAKDADSNFGFIPAALPTNLTATVSVYNAVKNQLQLNITWTPNKDGPHASSYNIHVWALNETDSMCNTEPYYAFIENPVLSSWVISPNERGHDMSPPPLIPSCSYRIRLEANPHNGRTFLELDFTVPDCVEEICNCQHAKSLPKPKLHVEHRNWQTVNITWNVTDLQSIESFFLRVGPKVVHGSHSALYNWSWSQTLPPSQSHILYTARDATNYAVTLKAVDIMKCSGPDTQTVFTINEEIASDHGVFTKKEVLLKLLIPLGAFLLVLYFCGSSLSHKFVFWLKYKKQTVQSVNHGVFYRPITIKSEKVFRRTDSLQERNVLYVEKEIEDAKNRGDADGFEICYSRLIFEREIGHGAFGQVFLAKAEAIRGVPGTRLVAVKKLKALAGSEEREDFLEEIAMLKRVGRHPNIVCLLACVTLRPELCMVMEYAPCGDLRKHLRVLRRKLEQRKPSESSMSDKMYSSTSTAMTSLYSQSCATTMIGEISQEAELNHSELQKYALQVARGMSHLESKRIIHRDLAARNILIDNNKVLKISDFGLSRRGVYVNTRRSKVPLRWLSIEAMRDSLYSSKSDVWAFAVLLWEIGTLGGFPYPNVCDNDVLSNLQQGKRLEKPDIVSQNLYSVMLRCWSEWPDNRPSFAELVSYLEHPPDHHAYVELLSDPQLPPTTKNISTPTAK